MIKKVSLITLLLLVTVVEILPASSVYDSQKIEHTERVVRLNISGKQVQISGAEKDVLKIYNLTGNLVKQIPINSSDFTYTLDLPNGCYLFKTSQVVRKFTLN